MNQTKVIVAIVLAGLLGGSWVSFAGGAAASSAETAEKLRQAEEYRQEQLYYMSIQSYESVLQGGKAKKEIYEDAIATYELYYQENRTYQAQNSFADLLSRACKAYPGEESFWERYMELYMDRGEYGKAYQIMERARRAHVSSERIAQMRNEAYYAFRSCYGSYAKVLPGGGEGGRTVLTANGWGVVALGDEVLTAMNYTAVGPVGSGGNVAVTDGDGESWLLNYSSGVPRARYEVAFEEMGCWSEGLIPARVSDSGTWGYYNDGGSALQELQGFQAAGSFYDGTAAVQSGDSWKLINTKGEPVGEETWQEIRLDANGAYLQNGRILAKSGNAWRLYDKKWKQVGEFQCEDIDINVEGKIAFCRDGKWGFVSDSGEELIAPTYEWAKSYSGGVAAVCMDGKWGFVDGNGTLVVDCQFADVGYFSADGSCVVQDEPEGSYHMIEWEIGR